MLFGLTQPNSQGQLRYTRIAQGASTALANKGIAFIVSFISVPLTVGYLGAERYGAWILISTLLAWINLADLGLVNGLVNSLSEAYGKDKPDQARTYVASTFWMLVFIAIVLGVIYSLLGFWIDWGALFNVHNDKTLAELGPAITLSLIIFILNFPLSIVSKIYIGYQQGNIANYWDASANIFSLIGIILVTQSKGGLVWLVAGFSGSRLIVTLISAIWLFCWHKPWLMPSIFSVQLKGIKKVGGIGAMFFFNQISTLLIFQTDNLIISHFLGAKAVTPYSVTWRLFSYLNLLPMLISPYLWPAYGEAYARKDFFWMDKSFKIYFLSSLIISVMLSLPFVYFGVTIIEKWAGAAAVPPFSLLIWMGCWSILYAIMSSVVCLLGGTGHLKKYTIYGGIAAGMNVLLSVLWVKSFGLTGVIAATVVSVLLFSLVPASLEVFFLLKRLSLNTKI